MLQLVGDALLHSMSVTCVGGARDVPPGQTLPGGHMPEHEAEVSPAELPNVPEGQAVHTVAPSSEYVPAGHNGDGVEEIT